MKIQPQKNILTFNCLYGIFVIANEGGSILNVCVNVFCKFNLCKHLNWTWYEPLAIPYTMHSDWERRAHWLLILLF